MSNVSFALNIKLLVFASTIFLPTNCGSTLSSFVPFPSSPFTPVPHVYVFPFVKAIPTLFVPASISIMFSFVWLNNFVTYVFSLTVFVSSISSVPSCPFEFIPVVSIFPSLNKANV